MTATGYLKHQENTPNEQNHRLYRILRAQVHDSGSWAPESIAMHNYSKLITCHA